MTKKLLDDCFLHDKDRISHADALATLRARLATVVGVEDVPVAEAAGRMLAEPVTAPRPIMYCSRP
jgi:molybdopterin molybdotransferase